MDPKQPHGTSILLLGPQSLTHLALIRQLLHPDAKVLHLHGNICSDPSTILNSFQGFLQCSQPLLTFEEMSQRITDRLEDVETRPLYVVLQAFERFATISQHFLYTLFDLSLSHRIFIICSTTRCDVIDLLEKRVKSRFSQNIIYLPHPKSFEDYLTFIKRVLCADSEDGKAHKRYNESVLKVLTNEDLQKFLLLKYEENRDPLAVLPIFTDALIECDGNRRVELKLKLIMPNIESTPPVDRIEDLSMAEWCALVALKRAKAKNPDEPANFDVLFDEYHQGFAASAKINDGAIIAAKFQRPVIRSAVDSLIMRGILRSAKGESSETIDSREELLSRLPLSQMSDILRTWPTNCPSPLKKLAAELDDLLGEDSPYHKLVCLERELDHKITRKQTQIADAAFKVNKVKRTLKVYVSHYSESQPTFGIPADPNSPPSWTLRIDARLESYGRQGRSIAKPFSHFIKSLVIQLGEGQEEDQIIEWNKAPGMADTDGFEVRRTGTTDTPVRIILRLDFQPERFRPSPELAEIIDLELATRPQIVLALWQYIKLHKLQESDEKKVVNNDDTLRRLFGCDKMSFSEIPAKLDPHLLPPEPIELDYLIVVDRTEGSTIWDIDVEIDDPSKPRPLSANLVAQQREIALLEQKIAEVSTALKSSAAHESILRMFAKQPVECMRRLMEAHCADQEIALGEPAITLDDLINPNSFDNEEMERAISLFAASSSEMSPFRL